MRASLVLATTVAAIIESGVPEIEYVAKKPNIASNPAANGVCQVRRLNAA